MIISNQKSKCCNAPLLANMNEEGTCFYRCSKCNEPTDAVRGYLDLTVTASANHASTLKSHIKNITVDASKMTWGIGNQTTRPELHSQTIDNLGLAQDIPCTKIRVNNDHERILWLQTRISELENEVANLRAKNI